MGQRCLGMLLNITFQPCPAALRILDRDRAALDDKPVEREPAQVTAPCRGAGVDFFDDAAGVPTLARIVFQKEALMSRLPIYAQATLVFGLVIIVGCLTPATARAYTYRFFLDCGARWDLCVPACDYSLLGGPALGRCYDFCSRSRGICEASRIPVPASYRSSRYSR